MGAVIDWSLATRLAAMVAGGDERPSLPADLARAADDSERLVGAYTGLVPATPLPAAEALTRAQWTRLAVDGFRPLLDPVADRLGEGLGPLRGPVRGAAGVVLAAELGLLTGYLGQRVLGQYDLALMDAAAPPRLVLVAENLREAVGALRADPEDLVTWVTLHEVTHAFEFAGVPWLRDHLASLLRELLEGMDVRLEARDLLRLPSREDLRAWAKIVREGGLVALVATPEQRRLLDRVQAVMTLLEGYSEHVMDAVGRDLIPKLDELRAAFDRRRRSRPAAERLLQQLIGLDLKLRQYEVGKRFCDAVVAERGIAGLNAAWEGPAALPTLPELKEPETWLKRLGTERLPRPAQA